MSADPFRADPELCAIGRQTAAERRHRRQLAARRAGRPDDAAERAAIHDACARYADLHGPSRAFSLLSLELARYAPDIGAARDEARAEAEQVFRRGG